MWKILRSSGIAPASISGAWDDDRMPTEAGVGFTDVGTGFPGTDRLVLQSNKSGYSAPVFDIFVRFTLLDSVDHFLIYCCHPL